MGPRIALSLFSALSLPVLQQAIAAGDAALLAKSPGIGKKTAERLCVELRDVVGKGLSPAAAAPALAGSGGAAVEVPGSPFQDAVAALQALGYKPDAADKAVRRAQRTLGDDAATDALVKAALR